MNLLIILLVGVFFLVVLLFLYLRRKKRRASAQKDREREGLDLNTAAGFIIYNEFLDGDEENDFFS